MDQRLLKGGLVGLTLSSVLALLLYVSAVLGSSEAATALLWLSLPPYNPFAFLISEEIIASRFGMQAVLGAIILLLSTASFLFGAVWAKLWRG